MAHLGSQQNSIEQLVPGFAAAPLMQIMLREMAVEDRS
jgi:hypothetical protein